LTISYKNSFIFNKVKLETFPGLKKKSQAIEKDVSKIGMKNITVRRQQQRSQSRGRRFLGTQFDNIL
jgi:hypothetical protein